MNATLKDSINTTTSTNSTTTTIIKENPSKIKQVIHLQDKFCMKSGDDDNVNYSEIYHTIIKKGLDLLSLFGNAHVRSNPNSNRFMQIIKLNYKSNKKSHFLTGVKMKQLLFEKNRIVDTEENNVFHILHALLEGLYAISYLNDEDQITKKLLEEVLYSCSMKPSKETDKTGIKSKEKEKLEKLLNSFKTEYKDLINSGLIKLLYQKLNLERQVNEDTNLYFFKSYLENAIYFDFPLSFFTSLNKLLLAILLLGDINFVKKTNDEAVYEDLVDENLEVISKYMQCNSKDLLKKRLISSEIGFEKIEKK